MTQIVKISDQDGRLSLVSAIEQKDNEEKKPFGPWTFLKVPLKPHLKLSTPFPTLPSMICSGYIAGFIGRTGEVIYLFQRLNHTSRAYII